ARDDVSRSHYLRHEDQSRDRDEAHDPDLDAEVARDAGANPADPLIARVAIEPRRAVARVVDRDRVPMAAVSTTAASASIGATRLAPLRAIAFPIAAVARAVAISAARAA